MEKRGNPSNNCKIEKRPEQWDFCFEYSIQNVKKQGEIQPFHTFHTVIHSWGVRNERLSTFLGKQSGKVGKTGFFGRRYPHSRGGKCEKAKIRDKTQDVVFCRFLLENLAESVNFLKCGGWENSLAISAIER